MKKPARCDDLPAEFEFVTLRRRPELEQAAAAWFHSKWKVPEEAYLAEMDACLRDETPYDWYLCLYEGGIAAGLGVIENDFHDRKDLAPNVCAVYTEPEFRGRGIAGKLEGRQPAVSPHGPYGPL